VESGADEFEAVRILVAQLDGADAEALRVSLSHEGYRVESAASGADVLRRLVVFRPHLVILDVVLSDMNVLETCRRMRELCAVSVIVVSASRAEDDIVSGLEAGASDYVVRPFHRRELVARIEAVLRRVFPPWLPRLSALRSPEEVVVAGPVCLDASRRVVTVAGLVVPMSRKEFDLLAVLMSPVGRVRTRDELIDTIWSGRELTSTRTLDTHIRRLRRKIEDDLTCPRYLVTVRGVGFRFDTEAMSNPEYEYRPASLVG
jgi:two-component system response regulator RegX3